MKMLLYFARVDGVQVYLVASLFAI